MKIADLVEESEKEGSRHSFSSSATVTTRLSTGLNIFDMPASKGSPMTTSTIAK